MRRLRFGRIALLAIIAGLVCAAGAYATVIGLPADGSQVNNDPANGIDPNQNAGVSDVVGGSLAASGPRVPWATFEQQSGSSQQIFVRAFKNGQWVTQGQSLNIDPNAEAEAPSIDFAGAGRNVPVGLVVRAQRRRSAARSRSSPAASTPRPTRGCPRARTAGPACPSLNIHTDKEAENPSVAGGAAVPGNAPVPWVAWQEQDGNVSGSGNHDQIFVSKGVKQAAPEAPCTGFKPSDAASVSAFCWQQVGLDRLDENGGSSATGDPTLNVDPSRDGVEPDIAFTGASDKVAWVVWYEQDHSSLGLRDNEQVFAAKIVADANADGGFHWQAVGNGTDGTDQHARHVREPLRRLRRVDAAEDACSLNTVPANDAEDPRVATGTLTPGAPTVPWVVWAEDIGTGTHAIFVSRLVGGDHFELFNGGAPVSPAHRDAESPDITFFGNVPYVSWIETHGDVNRGFVGHFEAGGQFVLDTPVGILLAPHVKRASLIDARVALSSSCTADPFTNDGPACPVAAVNAPFATFTTAGSRSGCSARRSSEGPTTCCSPAAGWPWSPPVTVRTSRAA